MQDSRRGLLIGTIAGVASMLASRPLLLGALQSPQPLPSPHAPNQNIPAGMDGPDLIKPSKAAPSAVNQEQIAASVQQLYRLAGELKDEVDRNNLQSTFPISIVKKAQQIEKLAKQIKERAKG